MFKKNPLVVSVMLALSLTACGSGGGSDNSPPSVTTSITKSTTGKSAAGIILGGKVTVHEFSAAGVLGSVIVGEGTTDAVTGKFSFEMNDEYQGGAVFLSVGVMPGQTLMICDTSNGCGAFASGDANDTFITNGKIDRSEKFQLPEDFVLNAVSPPITAENQPAQITVFTHIAAAKALKVLENGFAGKTVEDVIREANGAVSNALFGVNTSTNVSLLGVEPVDSTSVTMQDATISDEQKRYAIFNEAMADLLWESAPDQGTDGVDASDVLALLDGVVVAGMTADDVTLIPKSVMDQVDFSEFDAKVGVVAETLNLDSLQSFDNGIVPGVEVAYTPPDISNATEVEKAKDLVLETRTWLTSLSEFKSPADALAGDAKNIAGIVDQNSEAVLELSMSAVMAALNQIIEARSNGATVPASSTVTIDGSVLSFTWSESPTMAFTLSANDYHGVKFNYTVTLDQSFEDFLAMMASADSASASSTAPVAPKTVTLAGQTITGKVVGTSSNAAMSADLDVQLKIGFAEGVTKPVVANSVAFQGDVTLAKLSAGVATGDEISGAALIEFVPLNSGVAEGWSKTSDEFPVSLSRFKFGDVTVKNAVGSTAGLGIDLNIDNAADFDTVSLLDGNNIIWFRKEYYGQDLLGFSSVAPAGMTNLSYASYTPATSVWSWDGLSHTYWNGYDSIGNWVDSDEALSATKVTEAEAIFNAAWQPSRWVTNASLSHIGYNAPEPEYGYEGGTSVEGLLMLDQRESAEHFIDATLNISGKLALVNYPEATISAMFDRTAQNAATASVILTYNGQLLDIDMTKSEDAAGAGVIEVTNANGAKLTVNVTDGESGVSGSVTVDGKVVGTITGGILRYNDGTFESLN